MMRANSGSERIDVPSSNRNAERFPTANRKYARKPSSTRSRSDAGLRGRLGERAEQLAAGLLEQLDVERALAREVLVEHRLGDARRFGDLVHRGRVEALLREAFACDLEELLAALIGRHAHGGPGEAVGVSYTLDFSGIT